MTRIQSWLVALLMVLLPALAASAPPPAPASAAPLGKASSTVPVLNSPPGLPVAAASQPSGPLRRVSNQLGDVIALLLNVVVLLIVPIGARIAWKEWHRRPLVVEPFDVPKELQDLGLTGTVLSQLLSDQVHKLQRSARPDDDPSDVAFAELPRLQVDLQLPGVAWTIGGTVRYLRQSLGRPERRLIGEAIRVGKEYAIRLRLSASPAANVPVKFRDATDLDAAMASAARIAIALSNPLEAATIQYANDSIADGYFETTEALRRCLANGPAQSHPDAYVLWASVHRVLGQNAEMEARLAQARLAYSHLHSKSRWHPITLGRALRDRTRSLLNLEPKQKFGTRYCNFVGNLLREQRDYHQAKRLFKMGLCADRGNIAAMSNLGMLYHDMWRLDEAQRWFLKVVRKRALSSRGYRGLGLVAMKRHDPARALALYRRAVDVGPKSRWPRLNYIDALRRSGKLEQAAEEAQQFSWSDPNFAPLLRTWGDILKDSGDLDAALAKYERAIPLEPGEPWGHNGKSDILRRQGKTGAAIESALAALAVRPTAPGLINSLANALRDDGRHVDCLKTLNMLVQGSPQEPFAHSALADELRRQAYWERAEAVLLAAPDHCKKSPEVLRSWGWLHMDREQLEDALLSFEKAAKAAPRGPWCQMARSEALRRLGRLDDAAQAAQATCEEWPSLPDAWRRLASVQASQKDFDGAARSLQRAVELAPHDPESHVAESRLMRDRGLLDWAVAAAGRALSLRPRNASALRCQAEALQARGDFRGAVARLCESIAAEPRTVWGYLSMSDVLRHEGDFGEAIKFARQAADIAPASPVPSMRFADVLKERAEDRAALEELDRAIELAPLDSRPRAARADMLRSVGRYEEAIAAAQDVLKRRPSDARAKRVLGDALRDLWKLGEAEKAYRETIACWPADVQGYVGLAEVLIRAEKWGSARTEVQSALSVCSGHPGATRKLARIEALNGKRIGALRLYRQAVAAAPCDVWGYADLATFLREQGRLAAAEKVMQAACKRLPGSPHVYRNLGLIYRKRHGDGDIKAGRMFCKAIRVAPGDPDAHLSLAQFFIDKRRWDRAERFIASAMQVRPGYARALRLRATLLVRRGDSEEAVALLTRVTREMPRDPELHLALCRFCGSLSDWDGAIRVGRNAVELQPRTPAALELLASALERNGTAEAAEATELRARAASIKASRSED